MSTRKAKTIESAVRKALYDFELIGTDAKIAVALSGGKDSLTLLHMLQKISGRGFPAFELHAIHVSGAFSCGAGVHTRELQAICDKLQVPLTVCTSEQRLEDLECYSCSRERRKLLFNAASKLGISKIAFGHHKDDHVQTLLMNLLHKAEFCGNLAKVWMRVYEIEIIRPLLYVAEADIVTFAKQMGYARVMCRCPVGQHSMRRKVKDLLEEISNLFPNARDNLAMSAFNQGKAPKTDPLA